MRKLQKTVIVLVVAVIVILLWGGIAGPMLVDIRSGPLSGIRLFNPLRNRSSERFAVELLRQIQSGDCSSNVGGLTIPDEQKRAACEKQAKDPLALPCRLIEREDKGTQSWVLFECRYVRRTDARAEVGVSVSPAGQGWAARSYERIY